MKASVISLSVLAIFLISFNSRDNYRNSGSDAYPYMINLEKGIKNVRSVPLSSLGSKLEYIPLETNPACLIKSVSNVFVSDSFLYVSDGSRLLLFGISGKFIRQIGSAGRGPGEYSKVADFIVDGKSREIYVLSSRLVLIYDFNGKLKRDFKIEFPCNQFIMTDRNSLMFHPFNLSMPSTGPVYSLYKTDKTGVVSAKIINTLKRVNRGISVPTSPLYMYNGIPHFMEFGIDTLYTFNNLVKKPYAFINSGKMKMEPDPTMAEVPGLKGKIWISDISEITKSMFIKVWWNMSDSISSCIFDKSSSVFTALKENGFVNDIDGGMTFWPKRIQNDNTLIDYTDSFTLIQSVNKSTQAAVKVKDIKKADQLRALVKQLNETSNPVLIILRQ
jgi:hypothetical protein